MTDSTAPIFILGVPRSGTTLLRAMLDSHPSIACGPETPWLGGHQPRSVMELCRALRDDPKGYCTSFGMPEDIVTQAARDFVSRLMNAYAQSRGKRRWAEKTPDNALHVDFLRELFPKAKFVHLVRDGLDVAASTSLTSAHRRGVSAWHERKLNLGPGATVANTPFAALLRWRHWNRQIERSLAGHEHLRVEYESLVQDTERTLRHIMEFVGEAYDPVMLNYAKAKHDMPEWEWGTADLLARKEVSSEPIGRARELPKVELELLRSLAGDAEATPPAPAAAVASVAELGSEPFVKLMQWFNRFAKPLGLRTFAKWSKSWEYPWLWFRAIGRMKHDGLRAVDLGSELSPMPWILGMLGARVTIVEVSDALVPRWEALRDRLRVDVDWIITGSEEIPVPDASVDLLTSFSVIEHQPDKRAAMDEAARILKPGGAFALSFDLVNRQLGMKYPESYGEALTFYDFHRTIWGHPGFGNREEPAWNYQDQHQFLKWHLRTSPDHNYIVGAAVLMRSSAAAQQQQTTLAAQPADA